MWLPRLHLIEIHEQVWFPTVLRDYVTDCLSLLWTLHLPLLGTASPMTSLAPLLARFMRDAHATVVFGLCSGAAGPDAALALELSRRRPCPIDSYFISDLMPNVDAFNRVTKMCPRLLRPVSSPVDATSPSACEAAEFARAQAAVVVRLIFASFHHFRPSLAKRILAAAVAKRDPIAILEATHRDITTIVVLGLVLFPLAFVVSLILLWSVNEGRLSRFLWCVLCPIVPLVVLIDGITSCLRTHSEPELHGMAKEVDPQGSFEWMYQRVPIDAFGLMHVSIFQGKPLRKDPKR